MYCCILRLHHRIQSKLPSFGYSQKTTIEGVSGVCITYLIVSKHVWRGAGAVMPHSSFFGDPVYIPILTTTVHSMFPNSHVDE